MTHAPLEDLSGHSIEEIGASPRRHAVEAAGALVWRERKGVLEVQLIHRPRYDDWSWPKGKVDPGETLRECAVREVAEETGHDVVLGIPLPMLRYRMRDRRFKRVHYWAARRAEAADQPAVRARKPATPVDPEEIDDAVWVPADQARAMLTRRQDRTPLDALVEAHTKGRLATTPLLVARHARARKRSAWAGSEEDRPLTPAGYLQAALLVPIAAAYGVREMTTSRWLRCADTIAPYGRATGLTSGLSFDLTELAHAKAPGKVTRSVTELLSSGVPGMICTHRPVLPTVLGVIGEHARASVRSQLPTENPYLKPAEVLVVHVAQTPKGPRVVAVEQTRPLLPKALPTS